MVTRNNTSDEVQYEHYEIRYQFIYYKSKLSKCNSIVLIAVTEPVFTRLAPTALHLLPIVKIFA